MKVPAVAIAAAFTGGILGLCPPVAPLQSLPDFLLVTLLLAALLLAIGFASLRRTLLASWLSLAVWLVLGIAGASFARRT